MAWNEEARDILREIAAEMRKANRLKSIELKIKMDVPLQTKDIEDVMKGD
jgi:hypothetical protein